MRTLTFLFMLVLTTTAYAQIPAITAEISHAMTTEGVTERDFVVGIGTAPKHLSNAKELATENALADVYTQVARGIRAIIHANKDTPFQDNVAEHYSTVAQMPVVAIVLPRLIEIPLSPSRASDDKNTYAVVAVNREEIINLYSEKAKKLREKINATLAEDTLARPTYAAGQYLDSYRLYEELKEAELVMVGAEYTPDPRAAFDKLYDYTKVDGSQQETVNYLDTYFQNAVPVMTNNSESIATVITAQFEMQGAASPSRDRVQLDMFTYGVTEVATGFSDVLVKAIERKMTKKWDTILKAKLVSDQLHPYSTVHSLGFGRDVKSRLTGTYWGRGNKITVRATLRDVNTGEFQAVAIVRFNKNALSDVRTDRYKPSGYDNIVREQMIVAKAEIGKNERFASQTIAHVVQDLEETQDRDSDSTTIPIITGRTGGHIDEIGRPLAHRPPIRNIGFNVQVKTDKGFGPQTYAIGEPARFFVSVNSAAYIRLLYQENGRWSQLTEDQYIRLDQVAQWLEIPGDFVFAAPVGVGQLVVLAKTTPFTPITEFYYQAGYRYVGKPPRDTSLLTDEARNTEAIEMQVLLRGPINKHFKQDIERTEFMLKGPINKRLPSDQNVVSLPDDSVLTSVAKIYLATVRR